MRNKIVNSFAEAVADIPDGSTIAFSTFGTASLATNLWEAIYNKDVNERMLSTLYKEATAEDRPHWTHLKQLKETGFSDTETWCLFACITEFVLPRLKRFKKINNGYPDGLTEKKWQTILSKMVFAFEWIIMNEEMTEEYIKLSDKKKRYG